MKDFLEKLYEGIVNFFLPKEGIAMKLEKISYIPARGDKSKNTLILQQRLNVFGTVKLVEDGDFGPATLRAVQVFQKAKGLMGSGLIGVKTLSYLNLEVDNEKPIVSHIESDAPWMNELEKHKNKHESNPNFQEYMNPYWKKSGLDFKGLVGSARAWCALFVFMGLTVYGFKTPINSFRAKAWDGWGHSINWKQDGFQRGAIIRINSRGNCTSASGNHLTTANGNCTAGDLTRSNATFGGYGGNQANTAKVSIYKASTICYVGWPNEKTNGQKISKPGKVTVSKNCTGAGSTNESTR